MTRRTAAGRMLASLSVAATCAVFVGGAAAVPPQSGVIDLLTYPKLRIDGSRVLERAGESVDIAGDVNGDGKLDLVLGVPGTANIFNEDRSGAYVVFGGTAASVIDLSTFDGQGFRIGGDPVPELGGATASAAGDVNGDGLADVVIGKQYADHNGRADSGSAYVVYGKASTSPVDLGALGSGGFRIDGATAMGRAGYSATGVGDVNKDGFSDLLVGAPYTADVGIQSGTAYVVFGSASPGNVDLAALGSSGFRIEAATSSGLLGISASPVGDMNGDGLADLVVGVPGTRSAYVVFGKVGTAPVNLGTLGAGGFRIQGPTTFDGTGEAVSGAGDVNGDGRPDVVLGASWDASNGRPYSGSASVVFGKTSATTVDLTALGDGGLRLGGAAVEDRAGWAVSGAGDVNGDGRADVLVGAPFADNNARTDSGSAYLVFGRTSTETLDLAQLGTNGYRFDGATADGRTGAALAGGRDLTGDGLPDVLVAAPRESRNPERQYGGSVYVFGFGQPRLAYAPLTATTGTAIAPHAPTQLERTGPASFQIAPPLPAGLSLDSAGRIAGTPTAVHQATHTVAIEDLVGVASAQLPLTVTAPPPPPPPRDRTAPRLAVKAAAAQRVVRQKRVVVRASCNEPCTLRAQGSIAILGTRVRIPLRAASAGRAATAQRTLGLALTKASLSRLSGFLAKGRRARATVTVTARDRAGNARTAKRVIAIRR
jgi:FG-GAP repeat/FG-GAP-like repeat/Putative Ig domain